MKYQLLALICLITCPFHLKAQGENNMWTFGFEDNTVINFNGSAPIVSVLPSVAGGNTSHWAGAVCYPNGQLRFFVRLKYNFGTTPEYYVFDALGNPIEGSDLNTDAGMLDFSMPVIIPRPGNADQYYIFHCKDDGLNYSLLDMSLNGGSGAMVSSERNVALTPPGSVFTRLITGIKSCDGSWLVIRSQTTNEFYSYHIKASGIDTQKITSIVGNFPLLDYTFGGFFKASPDGSMLATTNWAGVEWYDFEQCSGVVKNARVLDTTGNPPLYPGAAFFLPTFGHFTGVCFSPDNSKLYVTKNQFINYEVAPGELYQFDLSQPGLTNIINSKALIMTNLPAYGADISGSCYQVTPNPLGEIKAGPDGHLYIDNGSFNCRDTANVPPGFNPAPGFHAIDAPNNPGLSCLPVFNRIVIPNGREFYSSGYAVSYLSNQIVIAHPNIDTIQGTTYYRTACFTDSLLLLADTSGHCLKWDNSGTEGRRMVYTPGRYYVHYFKNCKYITDTFKVTFEKAPTLTINSHSCPERPSGNILLSNGSDTGTFRAIWKDGAGSVIKDHFSSVTDMLNGLPAGNYSVEIKTASGCDTVLHTQLIEYPSVQLTISPRDTIIRYGDSIILHASGAFLYTWSPTSPLDTATKSNPTARPLYPTLFTVLGIDQNGCTGNGMINIDIDYSMPDMAPNAFSPNGDGLNDIFRIEGIRFQKLNRFSVYNRYGQQIFSTMDPAKGWDGNHNGKPCDPGIYYYLIELAYPNSKTKVLKGDVTLIR
ncbi:gliding motility-associated C-terminal domain-containing protein [Pedobacter nutrimenti]|uniref:gliding motility-associated C-terminal domain-containing protein n=1 Tax=Pedobacter nutrimenti TaxID=1241337 RepID=UPI00292FF4E3|nr:gliding motility-associated C-terminal domain-containing protein [Pedobacter nutrimenti]